MTIDSWRPTRQSCFFIHIHKTGGMTLRQALQARYADSEWLPAEQWSELQGVDQPLTSFKLFQGHFRQFFRSIFPPGFKTFTFLRDPVERTLSHLAHMAVDPRFSELYDLARDQDPRRLMEHPATRSHAVNAQVSFFSDPPRPITLEMVRGNPAGEPDIRVADLTSALKNLDELDFVGFTDTLSADFRRVCQMLDLHPPLDLPLTNPRKGGEREAPSDELREMVRQANDLDCRFYAAARARYFNDRPPGERIAQIESLIDRGVYRRIDAPTEFILSKPLPATGLWNTNGPPGARHRWTGPDRDLTFEVALDPTRAWELELRLFMPRDAGELSALVDGRPVPMDLTAVRPKTAKAVIGVRPSPDRRVTSIALRCEHLSVASENDPRLIGLILTAAAIRPRDQKTATP